MEYSRPHSESVAQAVSRCASALSARWSGTVFRAVEPRFATSGDLVSGEGCRIHGGRWVPSGLCRAVHGSLEPVTALEESLATQRYYGISDRESLPRIVTAIDLDLAIVLDLHQEGVTRAFGCEVVVLTDEDWRESHEGPAEPLTRVIGRAAYGAGLEAVLVPSIARPGSTNIVVFPDNLRTPSRMTPLGIPF